MAGIVGTISQTDAHEELRFVSKPLTLVEPLNACKPTKECLSSAFKFSCVPARPSRDEGQGPEKVIIET